MILIQLLKHLDCFWYNFQTRMAALQLASVAIAPRIIMSHAVPSDWLDSEVQTNQAEDETFQVLQSSTKSKNEKG